jgi:hypothetical protein
MFVLGFMLVWSESPELAGRFRRSVALLLTAVLLWLEPEAGKRRAADISFNKSASCCASGSGCLFLSSSCNHGGDGGGEKWGHGRRQLARRGSSAAFLWSSSVEDARRHGLSCLYFSWPIGGSPRPPASGCSTSWPQAILEASQLQPKVHRRCYPKWFVPGVGIAAPAVEFKLWWRKGPSTRLLSLVSFRGPLCKSAGPGCIFPSILDLYVNCNPTV